jgi:hypothetical protein
MDRTRQRPEPFTSIINKLNIYRTSPLEELK